MLGDVAVAVHPEDARYRHLIGKTVTVPLVGRDISVIADAELVDPALGTGAVKVTPAHDPNDYQCGLRHDLPMLNILNPDGTINANGGKYAGMERYKAREAVIADMEALGLFEGREDREIPLKFSDRSKTPIEPYLSDQWFVRMGDIDGRPGLAQQAMDAVTGGRVLFHPERYAKTYLDWLGEKRDWCISRQLWWGHRIPIWYARCSEADLRAVFGDRPDVTWRRDEDNDQWLISALSDLPELTSAHPGLNARQDPDVLDTWFSSALWPHATLGWPERTPELKYYYPTDVLVTGRGIITLWVARMVMTGLHNCGEVPFRHVYIYPTILDAFGETMSKSKGNGVDPLDIIEQYGTDALRFSLTLMATETQDVRMPVANVCPQCGNLVPVKQEHMAMRTRKVTCPACKKPFRPGGPWPGPDPELPTAKQTSERFEIGRNFANKLWNAARFLLLNLEGYTPGTVDPSGLPVEDRWVISRLTEATAQVTRQLEAFKLADAARTLYDFTWSEFCDWYVEMAKSRLREPAARPPAQRVLTGVLDAILRLLHPITPFVTESIWQALAEAAPRRGLPSPEPATPSVMVAQWPAFSPAWADAAIEQQIGRMQELVKAVRNVRNQFQVNEKATVDVSVRCPADVAASLESLRPFVLSLAKVGGFRCGPDVARPAQSAAVVHADFEAFVHLAGLIDPAAELKRLEKQKADRERILQGVRAKLANESFVSRAPAEVIAQQRQQEAELLAQLQAIEENVRQLKPS
jgi:valyl-tRNA synthetase